MTRETKIGLLVGLAFIIVIGILLSDQLMRSTEPPPAALSSVADTLRKGTVTPASNNPPVTRVVQQTAQDVSPETAVPTREEITRPQPPVTIVEIRPGGNASNGANNNGGGVVIGPGNTNNVHQGQGPVAPLGQAGRAVGLIGADQQAGRSQPGTNGGLHNSLAEAAAALGETLVGPDGQPLRATHGLTPMPPVYPQDPSQARTGTGPGAVSMKQHKAEVGDSLSRMASRFMGSDTKANRDAIIKANPTLEANPDMIIAGRTYSIPVTAPTGAAAQGPAVRQAPPAPATTADRTPAPIKAAGGEYFYQVKPGDSLTKIAKEQLGDATTVSAIKELNRDVVKDWNRLNVGTKLKLPAKPLASVQ